MTLTRRQFLAGGIGLAGAALIAGRAAGSEAAILGGKAFGTYWRAVLDPNLPTAPAVAAIEAVIAAVDAAMSPFRADSEIGRFNRLTIPGTMAASPPLCSVAGESLRIARLSGGAFDPTVGPAVHRYGFGPIEGGDGSYAQITVGDGTIGKAAPKLTLDLCGIAKGHALDRMIEGLRSLGHERVLLELGGEVRSLGRHPAGRPWQVAVESPLPESAGLQRIVRPEGLALATSGDRANSYNLGSRRYSHIIEPKTGAPISGGVASVTVLAPTAMEADGLATALVVLGPEAGVALCEQLRRPVLFLLKAGEGVREYFGAGFERHVLA